MALTPGSTIETSYINAFKAGFEQAFQQSNSRLRPYFPSVRQASEYDFYDRIGVAEDLQENNTRYGDNPMAEIPHDRRRCSLKDYDTGKAIDPKDLVRVSTDPTNEYTQAMVKAANRKVDDIIIDRIFGPAYTDKTGSTQVTFVTTNSGKISLGGLSKGPFTTTGYINASSDVTVEGIDVAKDFVTSGSAADSGITLDKLKAVRRVLLGLEAIQQDTILNCHLASRQFEQLLDIDEVVNADYALRKSLAEGNITTFMGYRFIHSERLTLSSGVRKCIISLPEAFKLAISADINVDMWRLTGKKNIPYIYLNMGMDGTRMWGEVTVKLQCVE